MTVFLVFCSSFFGIFCIAFSAAYWCTSVLSAVDLVLTIFM